MLKRNTIVPREEWGAIRPSVEEPTMEGVISLFVFTYTHTEPCHNKEDCIKAVQKLQRHHMARGKHDIPYSFVLGGDGNTYVGRGWRTAPLVTPDVSKNPRQTIVFARIGAIEDMIEGTGIEQLPPGSHWDWDKIVVRDVWEAQDPLRLEKKLHSPVAHVLFTYTNTDPCNTLSECSKTVRDLQRYHMRYHLAADIPYNFLIGGDGRMYKGRSWMWTVPMPPEYKDKERDTVVIARIGLIEEDPKKQQEDFKLGYDLLHLGAVEELLTKDFKIKMIPEDWNTYDEDPE